MKNPVLDVSAILATIGDKVSADTAKLISEGKIIPVQKIYRFARNLTGGNGIQKLYDETLSKTVGVTNIEKAKYDTDCILLGFGFEVAVGAADFTTPALLAAGDYSNKVLAPAAFTDSDLAVATITSLRASAALRIPSAIRNGKLQIQVGGKDIFEGIGDDLLHDGFAANTQGVSGDFSNFLSLLQTPRIVKSTDQVTPQIELPAAVGNYHAVRINHYVIELKNRN